MAVLSKREILFVLRMQNETGPAIKAMTDDLRKMTAELEKQAVKASTSKRGTNFAEPLNASLRETQKEAVKTTAAIRDMATSGETGLIAAADAAGDYVSNIQTLPSAYGPLIEAQLKAVETTKELGLSGIVATEKLFGGLTRAEMEGRKAADVLAQVRDILADMPNAPLFDGTAYRGALEHLQASGDAGNLANISNHQKMVELTRLRAEALEVLRQRYANMGATATSTEAELIGFAQLARQSLGELGNQAEKTGDQLEKMGPRPSLFDRLFTLKNIAIAAITALAGNALVGEADRWKRISGQLTIVTKDHANLLGVRERLLDIAKTTYSDLEATSQLYVRLAQRADQLGKSQSQMLDMTENVSMAMQVGGSTAEEAAAALRQFSQAIGSGQLRGDELNSIIENAPGLAKAFEDGLRAAGKEVTSLKQYIQQAKPSINELLDALETQGPKIREQFEKLPRTVGQGMTFLRTSFTEFIGKLDESSKASDGIANFFVQLGTIISDPAFISALSTLANLFGKVLTFALEALVVAVKAAAAVVAFFSEHTEILAAALVALGATILALKFSAMITGLYGIVSWTLKAVAATKLFTIALLTNPLTWIIVLLAAATAAIVYFGNRTYEVNGSVVSGWQVLKATGAAVFAALSAGVLTLWENIKTTFSAIASATANLGGALMSFFTGDWEAAGTKALGVVTALAGGFMQLKNVRAAMNEAGEVAFDNSITNSAIENAKKPPSEESPYIDDQHGDPQRTSTEKDKDTDKSNKATEERRKAIKALQDFIDETKAATAAQIRMNEEIVKGPAAVRELNAVLEYEKVKREEVRKLVEAGIDISKDKAAADKVEEAAIAAKNAVIAQQREELANLDYELKKNITTMREQQIVAEQAANNALRVATSRDVLLGNDLARAADYRSKLVELTKGYTDAEWGALHAGEATGELALRFDQAKEESEEFARSMEKIRAMDTVTSAVQNHMTAMERATMVWHQAAAALDILRERGKEVTPVMQAAVDALKPPENMFDAVRNGLRDYANDIRVSLLDVQQLGARVFGRIGDALTEMVLNGKANFGDLARSIIADITQMIVKALLFKAIMGLFPGLNLVGHSGGVVGVGHSGGIAGLVGGGRKVHADLFANAKRFHAGGLAGRNALRSGEVPIIAKKGEAILPTVRMSDGNFGVKADMGGGRGGVYAPQFNFQFNGSSEQSTPADLTREGQERFGQLMQGELDKHMQRRFEEWTRPGGQLANYLNRR